MPVSRSDKPVHLLSQALNMLPERLLPDSEYNGRHFNMKTAADCKTKNCLLLNEHLTKYKKTEAIKASIFPSAKERYF